jgi:hypothetical protein
MNPWNKTFYDRVIRTKIGQGLREQYDQDLARSLPHKLSTLLMQLKENSERDQRPGRVEKPACPS